MVQLSQDIFFHVKKQILDKLDIILQNVNLQILNYLRPQHQSFRFIQLSSFQTQITTLFNYLDRLYNSLNSSVSFSSIASRQHSDLEHYFSLTNQNQRLKRQLGVMERQMGKLKDEMAQLSCQIGKMSQQKSQKMSQQRRGSVWSQSKQQSIRENLCQMGDQVRGFGKELKKMLKGYKFAMLQSRAEIISKLKQIGSRQQLRSRQESGVRPSFNEQHLVEDGQEILDAIGQILAIC